MIIGVCGWIGSGKDTIADYLVNFHEFRRDAFAATLKDAVAAVFNWDRELLEGRTKQAREWREQVDPWWAEKLGLPQLTPRWVLQHWGTEVCRNGFHNEIWILSLENKLRKTKDDVVITDVRFPNEIDAIKKQGGKVVWVQRGPLPEWYETAVRAFNGSIPAWQHLKDIGIHSSESSWVGADFDYVISNNSSIEDLYNQIKNIQEELESSQVIVSKGSYIE